MSIPEKGDLVFMQFNPQSGRGQAGFRPAIELSPKQFNQITGFALLCPITSKEKGYPFEIKIPDGLEVSGVILTDQPKALTGVLEASKWQARLLKI